MSLADLFKTQTAYNLQSVYQDTPESNQAWKTAFDIANKQIETENNYAIQRDNLRKYYENQATSDDRVKALNAANHYTVMTTPSKILADNALNQKTSIVAPYEAEALKVKHQNDVALAPYQFLADMHKADHQQQDYQYKATQSDAQHQLGVFLGSFGFDPLTGKPRTTEELVKLGIEQGVPSHALALLYPKPNEDHKGLNLAMYNASVQRERDYNNAKIKAVELSKNPLTGEIEQAKLQENMNIINGIFGVSTPATTPQVQTAPTGNVTPNDVNSTFSTPKELLAYYEDMFNQAKTPEEKMQISLLIDNALRQRGWTLPTTTR